MGGTEWFKLTVEQALDVSIMMNYDPEVVGLNDVITLRDTVNKQLGEYKSLNRKLDFITSIIEKQATRKSMEYSASELEPKEKKTQLTDQLYAERALEIFTSEGKASASLLQRRMSVGYAKAARIMDLLEENGSIGKLYGSNAREVISID